MALPAESRQLPVRPPRPSPEGGLLRQFHAALREQDVGYADLRRVQPTHGGYLWVHPRFLPFYHRPLPDIPTS
jgi:hypothetical protein